MGMVFRVKPKYVSLDESVIRDYINDLISYQRCIVVDGDDYVVRELVGDMVFLRHVPTETEPNNDLLCCPFSYVLWYFYTELQDYADNLGNTLERLQEYGG